ncbi:hypothetical protein SAMN05518672_11446 [Chitinophaga sp. CF118]|uniref:hypothetical protein n=1 Tax=Chitinophaga sp. CF118 TaxID=1884367 RepID=UPI0008E4FF9C|nr:hypothetical protein [Chitinophaga sp. CF118]SFF01233.1 hypothetical protein SAMN05518672_11446 [Chitinophaga sp. CF118]
MKSALVAATIIGAAAAGAIIYLSKGSRAKDLMNQIATKARNAGEQARGHLQNTRSKVNNILHEENLV